MVRVMSQRVMERSLNISKHTDLHLEPPTMWRPVVGFPGYEVSPEGVIRDVTGKVVNARPGLRGRPCTDLRLSGKLRRVQVARVVCHAFHGEPRGRTPVHIDGDSWNCRAENVVWGPSLGHLDVDQVVAIKRMYAEFATMREICDKFGCDNGTVFGILHRETHADVVTPWDKQVASRLRNFRKSKRYLRYKTTILGRKLVALNEKLARLKARLA